MELQIKTGKVGYATKFSILVVSISILVSIGYWYEKTYKPTQDFEHAISFVTTGQNVEANSALISFVEKYPTDARIALIYGKLFELNFEDKKEAKKYLDLLLTNFPSSPEAVGATIKWVGRETKSLESVFNNYFENGTNKEKYYQPAMQLEKLLNKVANNKNFSLLGGNKATEELKTFTEPKVGAFDFQLMFEYRDNAFPITSAFEPEVMVKSSNGSEIKFSYDKQTGIVSAKDIRPGVYELYAAVNLYEGYNSARFEGGEKFAILPGRKYSDITYLTSSDYMPYSPHTRYLPVKNNPHKLLTNKVLLESLKGIPDNITKQILPYDFSLPEKESYKLIDLDNDGAKEIVAFYTTVEDSKIVILHWNGSKYVEETRLQFGYPNYLLEIDNYLLKDFQFPVVGIQLTQGGSGLFPDLLLITLNKNNAYEIIWKATGGDHGDWPVKNNKIVHTKDNFGLGAHADQKRRLTQEYEFNGNEFTLANQFSSQTR